MSEPVVTGTTPDAVETPAPAVEAPLREKGVCPIKAEYLCRAPVKVSLDAEGRTRGMNKGADRQRSDLVQGTERPTLEGESNFFSGETLRKIKFAVREQRNGGGRNDAPGAKRDRTPPLPTPAAPPVAVDETAAAPGSTDATAITATTATAASVSVEGTKDSSQLVPPSHSDERRREMEAVQRAKARHLFTNKLVLAPLTTVGNLPFRRVCKQWGADVTVSEMAVVFNLNRLQKNEWSLLRRHESEDLFGLQLAVGRANEAATFAHAIEASGFQYDFLDINCGCPVETIVKMGCGCGLWERKGRLREVVETFSREQSRPVSVKCRIGPDEDAPVLHKQIGEYASWGASAVTIHGRSRRQRYTKLANWDYVEQCATLLEDKGLSSPPPSLLTSLPVVGNGDIFAHEDVEQLRLKCPHVSSFMIGRGALVKPWIFEEIKTGRAKDISSTERLDILKEFARCGLAHWGADERGVMSTRRFLCEWLSFLHRYVPVGLLEVLPQRVNDRPPYYRGRDELETLMASDSVADWIRLSEIVLDRPVEEKFHFTPKHKSNSFQNTDGVDGQIEPEG